MYDYVRKYGLQPNPILQTIGYIGNDVIHGRTINDNSFSDWLYGDWNEEKFKQYEILHAVPGISNYMDYLLDYRADQEYLRRYGMDYTNIHDPRKLRQTNSSARTVNFGLNFVSSNVSHLYQ